MSILQVSDQSDQQETRCIIIHNETCRYPYNFIYKTVLVEATTYPKIKVLTSILLEKMKNVKLSYNFGYFHPCETALISMLAGVITYN